jgi:Zn-finger nucleic acid-binding protein
MEKEIFDKVDKLADTIDEEIKKLDKKSAFAEIEKQMNVLASQLPEKYSISLHFLLDVFDSSREKSLTIHDTGLAAFAKNEVYRVNLSGSTPHTYVVNGNINRVPHDNCPSCWGVWESKLTETTCPTCGITMGNEIKLVLDTDVCPFCENGNVTRNNPKCPECGFVVDGKKVYWG